MTSAEIASLFRFANGNVDKVSEILKSLDIEEPLLVRKNKKLKETMKSNRMMKTTDPMMINANCKYF